MSARPEAAAFSSTPGTRSQASGRRARRSRGAPLASRMASRKRPDAAKRTVARQEAARKRSAPGKRFVGEAADQSAKARRDERKKVARMARAARKAKPAEAARTAGRTKKARPRTTGSRASAPPNPARAVAEAEAAFRAAEEDAALHGAEVEPVEAPELPVTDDPAAATHERGLHLLPTASEPTVAERPAAERSYEPSVDVSNERGESAIGDGESPPLGSALAGLARTAFGLVRTLVAVPFRLALAIPRFAIRAVASV